MVVVACTGNAGASTSTEVWYPAREPGVIAVAGMERDGDALWSGSITGTADRADRPGDRSGRRPPGGYWRVQGTSFAAPMVSGIGRADPVPVAARCPAGEVVNRLIQTARDLGPAGRDDRFGFGLVDPARRADRRGPGPVARNPLDDDLSPGEAGFGPAPGVGVSAASGSGSQQTDQLRPPRQVADAVGGPARVGHGRAAGPAGAAARRLRRPPSAAAQRSCWPARHVAALSCVRIRPAR